MKIGKFNRKGISLIEVILTLAIMAIVIQIAYSIFFVGNKSFATSRDIGFAQQEVRNLSLALSREVNAASTISITDSITDLSKKEIEIQNTIIDGVGVSNIIVNGQSFGPFLETSFTVNTTDHTLVLPLTFYNIPSISDTLTVRLENWDTFLNMDQFINAADNSSIEFQVFYYAKY